MTDNPFKMCGSWLGAIIGVGWIIYNFIQMYIINNPKTSAIAGVGLKSIQLNFIDKIVLFPTFVLSRIVQVLTPNPNVGTGIIVGIVVAPIIFVIGSFLIGWGIHLLIRRFI